MEHLTIVVDHVLGQRYLLGHVLMSSKAVECQLSTVDVFTTLRMLEQETEIEILVAEIHTKTSMPVGIGVTQNDIAC